MDSIMYDRVQSMSVRYKIYKLAKEILTKREKTLPKKKETPKRPLAGTSGLLGMVGINKKMLKGGRTVVTPSGMSMKKLCDPKL